MKIRILAGMGAMLLASTAMAADLPRRTAPAAPAITQIPAFLWTGFYAGVNAGYGFGSFTGTPANGFRDPDGFVGGGQIGYNHQVNNVVFGLETDIQYADLRAGAAPGGIAGSRATLDYLGTVRGRVGYAYDRFLPYVTAGFAYGGTTVTVPAIGRGSEFNPGWTAGAGIEYAITNNLTAKVEGLYVDLAESRLLGGTQRRGAELGVIRAGLNAKF